jgi:UDP-glucose 4-epimerase
MAWALLDHGEKVVVIDNLTTGFEWAVPDRAKLVMGNIGDKKLVLGVIEENEIEASSILRVRLLSWSPSRSH